MLHPPAESRVVKLHRTVRVGYGVGNRDEVHFESRVERGKPLETRISINRDQNMVTVPYAQELLRLWKIQSTRPAPTENHEQEPYQDGHLLRVNLHDLTDHLQLRDARVAYRKGRLTHLQFNQAEIALNPRVIRALEHGLANYERHTSFRHWVGARLGLIRPTPEPRV